MEYTSEAMNIIANAVVTSLVVNGESVEESPIPVCKDERGNVAVLGRDLHKALEVKTAYKDWFPRMCEYGFEEGKDYALVAQKRATNNPKNPWTEITNHVLTVPMAKELCMLQRTEKGKFFRKYFIAVEEAWNDPQRVMERALQFARRQVAQLTEAARQLTAQVEELKPKASYCDMVLASKNMVPITYIAKDYGWSATRMNRVLKEKGVQYKLGQRWVLSQKYAGEEYVGSKTYFTVDLLGNPKATSSTYWTQKGRLFIYNLLKKDGIVPVMERIAS